MISSYIQTTGDGLHVSTELAAREADLDGTISYCSQVHSNTVAQARSSGGDSGKCDGLLTRSPEVILSIRVADCVPVFIHCPERRAIGLIHAGWRGTAAKISQEAVWKMEELFGSPVATLEVALGPSIGSCCYEVGSEVADSFSRDCLTPSTDGRYYLDLPQQNRLQLEGEGIPKERIAGSSHCTCCSAEMFHSYRRDGSKSGRMVCLLKLT